jgi:hypothetical protein
MAITDTQPPDSPGTEKTVGSGTRSQVDDSCGVTVTVTASNSHQSHTL